MKSIKADTDLLLAHAVCKHCGARWTVTYTEARMPQNPRECKNRECEAGWLDIPLFFDEADADRCAAEYTPLEKVQPDGTVLDSLGNFVGIDQPKAAAMREP